MKTKITLIALLTVLSTTLLNSQNAESNFRFGVELNFGRTEPTYINDGSVLAEVQNSIEERETGSIAYEIGLITEYKINSLIGIQTGIKYLQWDYQSKSQSVIVAQPDPALPSEVNLIYKSASVEIPVQSNFYFSIHSVRIIARAGFSPSINFQNRKKAELVFSDRIESSKEDISGIEFRRLNLNGEIGLGYVVELSDKMNLYVLPNLKFQSYGIFETEGLNRRLLFYGISVSTKFN